MIHRQKYLALLLVGTTAGLVSTGAYAAQEASDPYEDNLLGDLGGLRSKLSDTGVDITVGYKADVWNVASGGLKTGTSYMDNLDVKFDLDGEKLFGIKGNKSFVYFLNNAGGKTNARQVGSTQGIDNIEVGTHTFKLYEAWTEQSFFDEKLSLLVGLHDLNSEFAVTDLSGNFIKPTMQVMQTLAQSGQNGPSVFPTTSLAGRVKVSPTEESYISVAAFDGVPGNPARPHGTHIDLNGGDGLLLIAEGGLTPKVDDTIDSSPNKFALGGWMYTRRMDDLVDTDVNGDPVKKRMMGVYLLSSYQVYHDKQTGQGIGMFFRGGVAEGDTVQVDWDYELGVVGNGWVPTRPDSEIGAGFTQSHNGGKYVQSVGGIANESEYGVEIYYRDKIMPGLSVQPDFQYVINPGSDKVTKNATLVGMRVDINF